MVDVCLDSSVIIGLAQLTEQKIKQIQKTKNPNELPLVDIIKILMNQEINVIVSQTIYNEIKRGKNHDKGVAQDFLNNTCEVLHPTQEEKDLSKKLLHDYGNLLIDGKTAICEAQDYTQKNYRDASIIAEICAEQKFRNKRIPFITANIADVKDAKRINDINKKYDLPNMLICPISRYKEAINFAQKEDRRQPPPFSC